MTYLCRTDILHSLIIIIIRYLTLSPLSKNQNWFISLTVILWELVLAMFHSNLALACAVTTSGFSQDSSSQFQNIYIYIYKWTIYSVFPETEQHAGSQVIQLELWPHWHTYYWVLFHLGTAEALSFHWERASVAGHCRYYKLRELIRLRVDFSSLPFTWVFTAMAQQGDNW